MRAPQSCARPNAPTVLLSSGLGGTAGYWTPQLAALKARYRVVTYDQAGTGRNKRDLPADHSIAAMADEIAAVLDATKTDGSHHYYVGTYRVHNGVIVKASVQQSAG